MTTRPSSATRFLLPLAGLLYAADLPAQTLGGRFLDAAIDSIVEGHLATGEVAGLTVAADRGGHLLHLQGYGYADLELGVPTPLDAVYEIGSVTKQFTAVLAMMLVEEGLLDLEADISDYPPAFRELAAQALPPDTLLRLMEAETWDFEPGHGLIYNNTACFLLGRILEEVSGSSYADLLDERLLEPLGMKDTHYCDPSRIVKGRAEGYQVTGDGLGRAPYLDHRWPFAAGSMCSTARDLIRWNRALHGGEVLSAEAYRSLIAPVPLADGSPVLYAKGLVHRQGDHGEVIEHGGGIFGFLTDVRYHPDEELTVVVLRNTAAPTGPGEVTEGVAELLRPRGEGPRAVPYPGDLALLAGTYRGPSRGRALELGVRADGGVLYVGSNGGEEARLLHVGDGRFVGPDGTRVWFVDDGGGAVGATPRNEPVGMRFGPGASALYPLGRQGG